MRQIISLLLLLTFVLIIRVNAKECSAVGIAIDKSGKPIPNAAVIAHAPPTGWEDLVAPIQADANGQFEVPYSCGSSDTDLYVSPPLDFENEFIPISPPYSMSSDKKFGLRLPSISKGKFNVGRIIAPSFVMVRVRFIDEKGNAFLPAILDAEFWLQISFVNGKIARSGNLSDRDRKVSKLPTESALKLRLPEGSYSFAASFNENHGPFFYGDKIIDVAESNTDKILTIVMSPTKPKFKKSIKS